MPTVMGYDPLFQFLHEDDVVRAIVLTLSKRPRGVFNVAGPQPLPLSRVAHEAGRSVLPVPEFIMSGLLGRFGLPNLPAGALNHLKYPVVVDARHFRTATGFEHAFDEMMTIKAFRDAFPVPW